MGRLRDRCASPGRRPLDQQGIRNRWGADLRPWRRRGRCWALRFYPMPQGIAHPVAQGGQIEQTDAVGGLPGDGGGVRGGAAAGRFGGRGHLSLEAIVGQGFIAVDLHGHAGGRGGAAIVRRCRRAEDEHQSEHDGRKRVMPLGVLGWHA